MTQNDINIDELIQDNYIVPESIFDRKRTKTSHFVIPAIFSNNSIMSTEYFVNAFLDDENFTHNIKRAVFVLFQAKDNDNKWDLLFQKMKLKKEYVLDYITGTKNDYNLIMIVFQVPEIYSKDFINFKNGRYSHFSEEYKKFFPRYMANNRAQPTESALWKIINKSEDLKQELIRYFTVDKKRPFSFSPTDEIWGIPERKFEVYNYGNN